MSTPMPSPALPMLPTVTNSFYAIPSHTSCAGFSIHDYLPNSIVPNATSPYCAISANETTSAFQSCCSNKVFFIPSECVQVCYFDIANTSAALSNQSLTLSECLLPIYDGPFNATGFQYSCGHESPKAAAAAATSAASTAAAASNGAAGRSEMSGGGLSWVGAVLLSGLVWTAVA